LIDSGILHFFVNGLSEPGFSEADDLRSFDSKKCIQLGGGIFLDDRIVSKVLQNFRAASFRKVGGDEHEMQFAFAPAKRIATNQQDARFQDEREKALDGFGGNSVAHDFGAQTSVRFSGKMSVAWNSQLLSLRS
jgi:hypothetical protein